MALQYNDTSAYNGIIQAEERLVYSSDYGRISGNTKELAHWTVRNNQALARAMAYMTQFAGQWRLGDWNHSSTDTTTINIVSGTREYKPTTPEDVLFIFRVLVKQDATTSDYTLIYPVDIRQEGVDGLIENVTGNVGVPFRYTKAGATITLDPVPNYSATAGIKIYYQRAPHPFVVGDTTATAGIPSIFDQLIPLYAVDMYATENTNINLKSLVTADIARMEQNVQKFFAERSRSDGMGKLVSVKRSSR